MLRQFHFRVHKMSLTLMSSRRKHPCKCIVAARHKTGTEIPAFLRKTCSVSYALIPLTEFIEQVRESLTPNRDNVITTSYVTYRSTSIIEVNDKNATIAFCFRNRLLSEACLIYFLLHPFYYTMMDIEYPF